MWAKEVYQKIKNFKKVDENIGPFLYEFECRKGFLKQDTKSKNYKGKYY